MIAPAERQKIWTRAIEPLERGDMAGALFRLRKLLRDDFPAALVALGKIYEVGGSGVTRDYIKARRFYEEAWRRGSLVLAALGLGRLYFFGWGVERNYNKAREWYERVEANENPVAFMMLGHIYRIADEDLALARKYYEKSVERGNLVAGRYLAEIYFEEGRVLKGILFWVKAIVRILLVAVRNRRDIRLKML